jgi:hypothetical protein
MQHICQIISDLIDQQQRQITPVFTFATTFLSLLLTIPRTKLIVLGKALVHRIGVKLKQLGRADLVVSLLDFSDPHDRAFAAHLFTSVGVGRMCTSTPILFLFTLFINVFLFQLLGDDTLM